MGCISGQPDPRVLPKKIDWWCVALFPKILTYLWPDQKSVTLFIARPFKQYRVSDKSYNKLPKSDQC